MDCPYCGEEIDSITVRRKINATECWSVDFDEEGNLAAMDYAETDMEDGDEDPHCYCRHCDRELFDLTDAYPGP